MYNIMNKLVITGLLLSLLMIACGKEDPNGGDPSQELVYESLIAERDTLMAGETTAITATAEGYQLEYHWSATLGDILGSGASVQYATSPCHAGTNEVSCTVKDGNDKSMSKSVSIVVE